MVGGRTKLTFIIKNINVQSILEKYGLEDSSNKNEEKSLITNIQDISSGGAFFLDDSKTTHNVKLHTINLEGKLNFRSSYCYWDRNIIPIKFKPIGCPIEYVYSETLDNIEQHCIFKKITEKNEENKKNDKDIQNKGYYITDGCFCSLNCCLAFIKANIHMNIYKNSISLLYKIQREIFNKTTEIISAPDWRLLVEYGGYLDIEKFRKDLDCIEYVDKGIFIARSITRAYEEKYKL